MMFLLSLIQKGLLVVESLLDKNLIHVFEELNESLSQRLKNLLSLAFI